MTEAVLTWTASVVYVQSNFIAVAVVDSGKECPEQ